MKTQKLVLGTPAYRRQVDVEHVWQGIAIARACGGEFELAGFTYADTYSVDFSRNKLLHGALARGADWLLMIDADTFHREGADVVAMLREGRDRDAAVIAAAVPTRSAPGCAGHGLNARMRRGDGYGVVPAEELRGRVRAVDAIGAAFLAVRCDWMRARWPEQPWFATVQLPGDVPAVRSEDINFCRGVQERGGLILADGRFQPRHIGAE